MTPVILLVSYFPRIFYDIFKNNKRCIKSNYLKLLLRVLISTIMQDLSLEFNLI